VRRVTTRSTAQTQKLTRTARVAGEAFAYVDQDGEAVPARRWPVGGLAWTFVAIAAAAALFLGV
jgi:hypothetical protein